jgi:hypothetical protein
LNFTFLRRSAAVFTIGRLSVIGTILLQDEIRQ